MARTGRPTRYTKARADAIVEHCRNGLSKDDAARAGGIGVSTLYEWQAKFPDFAERLTRAREDLKAQLVAKVREGAAADPRIAIAMLERMYPEEWSKARILKLEGNPEKPVALQVTADEELREVARNLAALDTDALRKMAQ